MQPVLLANYLTELVHYPLPCKTSARNAVVPRWLGIANMRENGREKKVLKDAEVIIQVGNGWLRLIRDSGQEVMQNPPLVLGSVAAENITDMIRFTFNVHLDLVKKAYNGNIGEKWREKKTVVKTTKCIMQKIYTTFELGHTMVPRGVRTQGHAGVPTRGKKPSDCY